MSANLRPGSFALANQPLLGRVHLRASMSFQCPNSPFSEDNAAGWFGRHGVGELYAGLPHAASSHCQVLSNMRRRRRGVRRRILIAGIQRSTYRSVLILEGSSHRDGGAEGMFAASPSIMQTAWGFAFGPKWTWAPSLMRHRQRPSEETEKHSEWPLSVCARPKRGFTAREELQRKAW
jgi:hypothetical protein